MPAQHPALADFTIRRPQALSDRVDFQVYEGTTPVAYARLSSRQNQRTHRRSSGEGSPGVSYCLKIIEVSHHHRNRGVGSALLDEVIEFCRDQRVRSIYGEAVNDSQALRRFYEQKGFLVSADKRLHLPLD